MHVERNVAASLVSTLLHCGKSKDGLPAQKDLEDLGIRQDLHLRIQRKRTYLPPAPWSLSKTERKNAILERVPMMVSIMAVDDIAEEKTL